MDHLQEIRQLNNTYYVLRHGRSLANERGIIVSDPAEALAGYGLTRQGVREVTDAMSEAQRKYGLDGTALVLSSDYARARESAEIAREVLGAGDVLLTPRLRERFFGGWDHGSDSNYERVWADDARDAAHTTNGVESVQSVLERTTSLIVELEASYSRRRILLVSHGDPLQILQTAFERVPPSRHRALPHLPTGEVRRLVLSSLHTT